MSRRTLMIAVLLLLVASASFVVTVLAKPERPTGGPGVLSWLRVSDSQRQSILAADPTFEAEARALQSEVKAQRAKLAEALTSADATDEQILAQIERVNEAEHALERRVTSYLLKVRHHLTAEQRVRLMNLAAERVCEPGRGRGQGAARGAAEDGRGQHRGRGGQ